MVDKDKVLVIIPAYNEAECILNVVANVRDAGYPLIVVNDGSTDATLDICRNHDIPTLDLCVNLGIGGAVQAGHKYALANGYEADVQFDGDGQHDASYIDQLIAPLEKGGDLVIGSRFLDGSPSKFKSTVMRRIGILWLVKVIRLLTGQQVTDPTSGFRACSKNAMALYCKKYPTDYPEPESIVEASRHDLAIREIPVSMNERQGGTSSINPLKGAYYMVKVTISLLISGIVRAR